MPRKQLIVFVVVLALGFLTATLAIRHVGGSKNNEIPYTDGLDAVPPLHVFTVALNMATLGHIERSDNRNHLMLSGQISQSEASRAKLLDLALSVLGAICLVALAKWVSRKIVSPE